MLTPNGITCRRRYALLAPEAAETRCFHKVSTDCKRHDKMLAEAQKLRGKSYYEMGALDGSQLTADGRHVSDADHRSWHLLTLDDQGDVAACLRYLAHPVTVSFPELTIAHSALAASAQWGHHLRYAVAREISCARSLGFSYVEMGGWAITEALRCTTEALRMVVTAYALAQLWGGALGITTASLRSCSASILRRIGGRKLAVDGVELPAYFDAQYKSTEIEILRFDSSSLNVRYRKWMEQSMAHLRDVAVIQAG
jgi:hypothetical protein